jgi:hypothetical protein
MAGNLPEPEALAKNAFLITMCGAVAWVVTIIVAVLMANH